MAQETGKEKNHIKIQITKTKGTQNRELWCPERGMVLHIEAYRHLQNHGEYHQRRPWLGLGYSVGMIRTRDSSSNTGVHLFQPYLHAVRHNKPQPHKRELGDGEQTQSAGCPTAQTLDKIQQRQMLEGRGLVGTWIAWPSFTNPPSLQPSFQMEEFVAPRSSPRRE